MEKIVIEVQTNPGGIETTTEQLKKLGQVDKQNADQFTQHHEKFKRETHDKDTEIGRLEAGIKMRMERIVEYMGAAFAVERIAQWGKECIDAAEVAQRSFNELKFVVLNIAKEGLDGLTKMTEQSEKLSASIKNLYSPRQIQEAQTMLLRAHLTTTQVMQLMPRITDIAAKTHKSIEEVAGSMARMFTGGRAMELSLLLGKKIKETGDQMKDFNNVMKDTTDYVGGAADAMDDLANKSQEASNQMEMQQERIGAVLAPIWEQLKADLLDTSAALLEFLDVKHYQSASDGFVKWWNAWTLGIKPLHLKTDMELNADAIAELQKKSNDELYLDMQAQYGRMEVARIANDKSQYADAQKQLDMIAQVYLARGAKQQEAQDEEKAKTLNFRKFTDAELQSRLQADKDQDQSEIDELDKTQGIKQKLNEEGFQKDMQLTEKEIKRREEAGKKLEEYYKKLYDIQKSFREIITKANADMITDDTTRKLAETSSSFEKQKDEVQKNIQELEKIKAATTGKARKEAEFEIEEGNEAILKLEQDKEFQLDKIRKEADKKHLENIEADNRDVEEMEKKHEATMLRFAELENDKKLNRKKETQGQHDTNTAALTLASTQDTLQMDKANGDKALALLKEQLDKKYITQDEYATKVAKINQQLMDDNLAVATAQENLLQAQKAQLQETIRAAVAEVQEMSDALFQNLQNQSEAVEKANNYRISQQDQVIQTERTLAEKGLANDLAFEMKRRDQLTRANIAEVQKQKKIKEFEIFLNALAKFTEENPKTALFKTGMLMSETKIAEAVYAEKGGRVGDLSRIGYGGRISNGIFQGRTHRQGGILVEAEHNEGIFSAREMQNLGVSNFYAIKDILRMPLRERQIPIAMVANMAPDNTKILEELEALRMTVKNKKETVINWDEHDNRIERLIENGITTKITNLRSRKRL